MTFSWILTLYIFMQIKNYQLLNWLEIRREKMTRDTCTGIYAPNFEIISTRNSENSRTKPYKDRKNLKTSKWTVLRPMKTGKSRTRTGPGARGQSGACIHVRYISAIMAIFRWRDKKSEIFQKSFLLTCKFSTGLWVNSMTRKWKLDNSILKISISFRRVNYLKPNPRVRCSFQLRIYGMILSSSFHIN